jgi:hypothetical protein
MIYRVLRNLDTGHKPGDFVKGSRFKKGVLGILLHRGILAPVSAPPLRVLPGWSLRAERLGEVGIDAIKFMEMDDDEIAEKIDANPRAIAKWRADLKSQLSLGSSSAKRRR